MTAAVTRLGDLSTGHKGFVPVPSVQASPNVFANFLPVVRQGDAYAIHCTKHCHQGVLASGSNTVYVNGKQIGRIGDRISCTDQVASGSNNVFA